MTSPLSEIADHDETSVRIRGRDLVTELLGKVTFTELMLLQLTGRMPDPRDVRVLDGCMVVLMEHGITPSVIASRLIYDSAPEALQGAIAAGICGVGSKFIGTMEGAAQLIGEVAAAADPAAQASRIVRDHRAARRIIPGFGHPSHRPDDPRTEPLLALLDGPEHDGRHIAALRLLSEKVDGEYGRHITINATGGVAAALLEIGLPIEIMRGLAAVSRSAGLVGHIFEERRKPSAMKLWAVAKDLYDEPAEP